MTTSDTCYRLVVAGGLSHTVVQLIDSRFGPTASIDRSGPDSAIDLTGDQPALRALLTLIWDLGHDLVAICECPGPTPGREQSPFWDSAEGAATLSGAERS